MGFINMDNGRPFGVIRDADGTEFPPPAVVVDMIAREIRAMAVCLPKFDDEGRCVSHGPEHQGGRCNRRACSVQKYLDAIERLPMLHAILLRAWARGELNESAIELNIGPKLARQCVHRANAAVTTMLERMPMY